MGNAVNILFPLLFLLGFAGLILGGVYLVLRVRSGEGVELSFRTLVTIYFYLMTILSFVVLLIGLSQLVNAGLSSALGREFSYSAPAVYVPEVVALPPPGTPGGLEPPIRVQQPSVEEQEERRQRQLRNSFEEGLLQGLSLSLVGGVVWGLHLLGKHRWERNGDLREPFFHKAYLAILLATASLVAVLTLPFGIYETLRYYIVTADQAGYRNPPGDTLSTALVFAPVWAYYLRTLLHELRRSEAA